MTKPSKRIKPGDLAILHKKSKIDSMVVWATWTDEDYSIKELTFWPTIVGRIKRGEVVLVVDMHRPIIGPTGAKICTASGITGWIHLDYLDLLVSDPAEV